jgi:hypothetical protein
MTQKVFAIDTLAGIQRDGTVFDKQFYNDGRWVRFQRGRPRKIGGYRVISNELTGPSRGIWVNAQNNFNYIFSGYSDGLQELVIDDNGVGAGVVNFTLSDFTPSALNLWQFDGFYDVAGAGVSSLVAHPGQDLAAIDNTTNTPVLIGDINGTTMSQIGVFDLNATLVNGSPNITLATASTLVGAGQSVSGNGIAANTTVVSVSGTTVTLSQNATMSITDTVTFNNNVSVSGGVVVLHPYVFVYGNNGLIRNCSSGNAQDWVSADANEVNVATGKIVQGLPVRGGSNSPSGLFWSIDSLVRVSYAPQSLGIPNSGDFAAPTFWRYDIISSQTSILSSQSVIEYDGVYYWCGVDRFLLYNGVVKEIPNQMNQNYFFDNLNYTQRQKVWATKVPRFGEVWWFYPKGNSTECNDAIIYNIRENTWYDAGTALGARRSAGYFSQVFAYPVEADWVTLPQETVLVESMSYILGLDKIGLDTYYTELKTNLLVTGADIPASTTLTAIQSSGVKTLGTLTAGSGYTDGTYNNVPFTGGSGAGATAQEIIIVAGQVISVTLGEYGAAYQIGDSLSADDADLGGGGGAGFAIDVDALYVMVLSLSSAPTATDTAELTFSTPENRIEVYQHEIGTDAINGQNITAIESYFETSDLGWVAGGPSQPSMDGANRWLRLERIEPDFIQNGQMSVIVTGRPYAQIEDQDSSPYVFDPNTGKIDMKEQRRELRLRFISNVVGGNYQLGRVILNADIGDVRGYS